MPQINFDANSVPESNYEPIPAGDYMVWISESHIETSQAGNQQLKVTMEVMQPERFAGRKLFASFTMQSNNPKAVETGMRILAGVCKAVGVMSPRDSEELHNIPFFTRVEVKQLDSGKIVNDPRGFWSTQSAAPPLANSKPRPPQSSGPRPGAHTGYMPQGQAAQPWQPPQQQQPQQAPQPPVQQQMSLEAQYRTQPAPQAYQPPVVPPAQHAPQGAPPWAQPRPAAPAPQAYAPPAVDRQPGDDDVPF